MYKRIPITLREWGLVGLRLIAPISLLLLALPQLGSQLPDEIRPVVVLGVTYIVSNLLVAFALALDYWSRLATLLVAILDIGLAAAAVALVNAPLFWLMLPPIALVGFYFDWWVALLAALGAAGTLLVAESSSRWPIAPAGIPAFTMAVVGVIAIGPLTAVLSRDRATTEEADAERMWLASRGKQAEALSRRATEYMRAVYELTEVLSASRLDPKRVMSAAIDLGINGLERTGVRAPLFGAVLLIADPGYDLEEDVETVLRVASISSSVTPSDRQVVVPGIAGFIEVTLRTAKPALCPDPAGDPEISHFESFRACRSVLCLPLNTGTDAYGVLMIGSQEQNAFKDQHVELMQAIANQAAASLQNAKLYVSLREQRDRIIGVEKSARAQLASQLHDGPTQSVAAIAMRLNYTRRLIEKKPEDAIAELYHVEDLARRTTAEIRTLLFELRPKSLDEGLGDALKQLALKTQETYGQAVEVEVVNGCDHLLDEQTAHTLFSIALETLNNARKHAQAEVIRMRLEARGNVMVMDIIDNGRGFDVQKALDEARQREGHLGLLNLFERAALVEGQLDIQSEAGQGTRTTLLIPLEVLRLRREEESQRSKEVEAVQ